MNEERCKKLVYQEERDREKKEWICICVGNVQCSHESCKMKKQIGFQKKCKAMKVRGDDNLKTCRQDVPKNFV